VMIQVSLELISSIIVMMILNFQYIYRILNLVKCLINDNCEMSLIFKNFNFNHT